MKLLLLGATHSEFHISQTLRELGHVVVHLARGDKAFCDQFASRISEDYADFEKVLQIAKAEGFDRVVSGANDFASRTSSQVNRLLRQLDDSPSQWEAINLKDGLRRLQIKLGIPSLVSQKFTSLSNLHWQLDFPAVIKATNLTGGKGVSIVSSHKDLEQSLSSLLEQYPRSNFIIQESFNGPLYSVTGLVVDGGFVPLVWFQEFTLEGAFWIKNAISLASDDSSTRTFFRDIEDQLSSICASLGLAGGVLHCQFTIHKGQSVIFDLARRIPGDMLVRVIELSLGSNWFKTFVSGLLFENLPSLTPPGHTGGVLRHCLTGRIGHIVSGDLEMDYPGHRLEHYMLLGEGSAILDLAQKVGIDFVQLNLDTNRATESTAALAQRMEY
jgi:biotin carboxylase